MRNAISSLIPPTAIVLNNMLNPRDEQTAQQGDI